MPANSIKYPTNLIFPVLSTSHLLFLQALHEVKYHCIYSTEKVWGLHSFHSFSPVGKQLTNFSEILPSKNMVSGDWQKPWYTFLYTFSSFLFKSPSPLDGGHKLALDIWPSTADLQIHCSTSGQVVIETENTSCLIALSFYSSLPFFMSKWSCPSFCHLLMCVYEWGRGWGGTGQSQICRSDHLQYFYPLP